MIGNISAGFGGAFITLLLFVSATGRYPLPRSEIAACAVGQNMSLRSTDGLATYRVTFKDGNLDKVECVKP